MPTYAELKEKQRELLAITSLTVTEFEQLLVAFREVYAARYPATLTRTGQPRRRRGGGGRKASLATVEDKLLFILMYQKTYPLQTVQGVSFGLSQPRTNELIHELMPLVDAALTRLGYTPERDPAAFPKNYTDVPLPARAFQLDGTERRRQRPKNAEKQGEHYSGKKKAHTDKNLLLIAEALHQVAYLSRTYPGATSDKKAADLESLHYPPGSRLTKDRGFQAYEPTGVFTLQPKKQRRGQFLSLADQLANRLIAKDRIVIEHILASVKRCRILKDVFRNLKQGFSDLVMQIACSLHNLRNHFRFLSSFTFQLSHYFR